METQESTKEYKYCSCCGQKVHINSHFCNRCGENLDKDNFTVQKDITEIPPLKEKNCNTDEKTREYVYEGNIHKCPHCGEPLKAFEIVCPVCKFEIRGAKSSSAVKDLAEKLEKATSENQRIIIIKNFPVPNTKEDIFEFMLLASSNFDASYYATHLHEEDISDAWLTKIEQCYQKAKIALKNENAFIEIQKLYGKVIEQINNNKARQKHLDRKEAFSNLTNYLPNILIVTGWIISLIVLFALSSTNTDNVGFNVCQLISFIDLIVGCIFIPKFARCGNIIPKLIVSVGLVISIIVLIPLSITNLDNVGFNACQVLLIVDIIVAVVIYCRLFRK
ncbi:MAG: hypothetical protein IJX51_06860 [Clostridia bacterium]|nr:hypothetical protein [Clostridia bacterium]